MMDYKKAEQVLTALVLEFDKQKDGSNSEKEEALVFAISRMRELQEIEKLVKRP